MKEEGVRGGTVGWGITKHRVLGLGRRAGFSTPKDIPNDLGACSRQPGDVRLIEAVSFTAGDIGRKTLVLTDGRRKAGQVYLTPS